MPWKEWQQEGQIYFWRFEPQKRGLAGWHFAADAEGKKSLAELLSLLAKTDYLTKRTIKLLRPPERISNIPMGPVYKRKIVSPAALRIVFDPDASENYWRVCTDGDHVELKLGRRSVSELIEGLEDTMAGDFDFAVGPHGDDPPQNIWFW